MSEHSATIEWQRATPDFSYPTYNRSHVWRFDAGIELPGRASPANVPATAAQAPGVDPEEGFVAAIASCHMLWFLHLACTRKFTVDRYTDHAVGMLGKNRDGKMAVTRVTLRPAVVFSGSARPTAQQLDELHERAHEECFIANSVLSEVVIDPQQGPGGEKK
jgi:organic hydroperoxide reductase OsmC/OhrA